MEEKRQKRDRKIWKGHRGFQEILLSFLCILVFPCLLLIVFVQKVYIGQINEFVTKNARERQARVVDEVELLMENVELLANSILLDEDFRKSYEPANLSEAREMMSKLNILALNQRYISNILVFNDNSPYIFSPNSSYSRDIFCNVYQFEDMDKEAFYEYLQGDCNGYLRAKRGTESYLVFCRAKKNYVDSVGVIIMVKQRDLDKILSEGLEGGKGRTVVFDKNGQEMLSLLNEETYGASDDREAEEEVAAYEALLVQLKEWEKEESVVSRVVSLHGKRYVVTGEKSVASGLSFVTVLSEDTLLGQANHWQELWMVLIAVTGLAGICVILCVSWLLYRPVIRLRTRAAQIDAESGNAGESDYDRIDQAMTTLSQNNSYLRSQIKIYNSYLLWKMVKGNSLSKEDEQQLLRIVNFEAGKSRLWNSILRTKDRSTESDVTEYLQSCLMEGVSFGVKELSREKCFLVVWSVKDGKEELLAEQLEAISRAGMDIESIVSGKSYDRLRDSAVGLIQARAVDECCQGRKGIFQFEEMELSLAMEEQRSKLEAALQAADWEAIRKSCELELAKRDEEPRFKYRYFCAGLLLGAVDVKEFGSFEGEQPDILEVLFCEETEKLDAFLKGVILLADRVLTGRNNPYDKPLIEKMKLYLAERYTDPNFSFQEAAEEYHMSLPALSKYFREKTGMVLNDYVTELKMSRAKYLLLNTDMAAADIALEVGYYNAASFSRRFRQIMGCSPSEYRKGVGKQPEETEN